MALTLCAAPFSLGCGEEPAPATGSAGARRPVARPRTDDSPQYSSPTGSRGTSLRGGAIDRRSAGTATGRGLAAEMLDRELRRELRAGPERLGDESADGRRIAAAIAPLADRPPTEGQDECEEAWEGVVAAAEAAEQPLDRSPGARRTFVDGCRRAPPDMRRCMSPNYRRQHFEECGEAEAATARRVADRRGELRMPDLGE